MTSLWPQTWSTIWNATGLAQSSRVAGLWVQEAPHLLDSILLVERRPTNTRIGSLSIHIGTPVVLLLGLWRSNGFRVLLRSLWLLACQKGPSKDTFRPGK